MDDRAVDAPARDSATPRGAWRALTAIAISTLLSMSVWFSATFVVPQLSAQWQLSPASASVLTIAVQAGFVVGALGLSATGLADALPPRVLMAVGAFGAAAFNLLLLWAPGIAVAVPLRLLTGAFLAGVYPPALKEVSTWFRSGRGLALAFVIGALTIGSASPHLVSAAGGVDWPLVVATTSGLSAAGGVLILIAGRSGPYPYPRSVFSPAAAWRSLRSRPVLLANLGYVGHMWELYAMWASLAAFLASTPALAGNGNRMALSSLIAFGCIAVGLLGCVVGGLLSDRWGRARAAAICLALSGATALAVGLSRQAPLWVLIVLCGFWGFWVIADSAQFSALVTENAEPAYVGSAVSLQLALGYLVTTATLWLVPFLAGTYSWSVALMTLAFGPAIGLAAMVRLDRREGART